MSICSSFICIPQSCDMFPASCLPFFLRPVTRVGMSGLLYLNHGLMHLNARKARIHRSFICCHRATLKRIAGTGNCIARPGSDLAGENAFLTGHAAPSAPPVPLCCRHEALRAVGCLSIYSDGYKLQRRAREAMMQEQRSRVLRSIRV